MSEPDVLARIRELQRQFESLLRDNPRSLAEPTWYLTFFFFFLSFLRRQPIDKGFDYYPRQSTAWWWSPATRNGRTEAKKGGGRRRLLHGSSSGGRRRGRKRGRETPRPWAMLGEVGGSRRQGKEAVELYGSGNYDDDGGDGGGSGGGAGRWLRAEEVLRRAPAVEERGKGGGSGDRQGRRRGDHGSSSVDDEGEGREGERRRVLGRCSARSVAAVGKERKPWNSMAAVTMDDDGGEGGGSGGGGGRWLRAEEVLRRAPAVEERGKGGGSDARQGRRRGDLGGGWSMMKQDGNGTGSDIGSGDGGRQGRQR